MKIKVEHDPLMQNTGEVSIQFSGTPGDEKQPVRWIGVTIGLSLPEAKRLAEKLTALPDKRKVARRGN
jgi:hypothetical protein